MSDNPFQSGLPDHLVPNPPSDIPEAPGAGNAAATLSPFSEPLDVDKIKQNLVLDRPLKLFVPNREKYPDHDFRIINDIPRELADAQNKGWRPVTSPEFLSLFSDLVAGTTEQGKAYRPVLMARSKEITQMVQKRNRQQLQSMYAGMDPKNRQFNSKYAENAATESKGVFDGANWRIRA